MSSLDPPNVPPHHARQLTMLRRMAELAMDLAEDSATQAKAADPNERRSTDHKLAFARSTQVVRDSIVLENRILEGGPATKQAAKRMPPAPDSRRTPLRQALYDMTRSETDRAARNQIRRMIDERVEEELRADPDHVRPLATPFMNICNELGLKVDVSQLSDEFLGMVPRNRRPPTGPEPPGTG